MKKKIFLIALMVALFVCLFAISISAAEPSYKDGEWIYAADGTTKLAIRDTDGNPLIWYMNGEELKWVRADQTDESQSVYVKYSISAGGSGFDSSHTPTACLKDIDIYDNGTQIECSGINSQLVLFNMERLNIDALNGWLWGNKNGCCTIMRGIVFPNSLKYIGQEGFTNHRIVQMWNLENTQFEWYNEGFSNPFSNKYLTQEATNYTIKFPDTLNMNPSVSGTLVKTVIFSPNSVDANNNQTLRDMSKLEKVYIHTGFYQEGFNGEGIRGTTNFLMFFTGTEEQAATLKEVTPSNYGHNNHFKDDRTQIISYETYLSDQATYDNATNKIYIVCGYNYCEAFYDGIHEEKDTVNGSACYLAECEKCGIKSVDISTDKTHNFTSTYVYENGYTQDGKETSTCTNAGCIYCADKEPKVVAIAPIFKNFQYSVREDDKFGIVMEYEIDREALTIYEAGANTTVKFGVVAIAEGKYNSEQDLVNADGTTEYENVIVADVSNNTPVKATLLINGTEELWESHKATPFYILGYAVNAGTVEYFQNTSNGKAEDFDAISFNGVKEAA